MKTNMGVIGTGNIARIHAEGVNAAEDIAELYAVCDIDKDKADEFAEKHGAAKVYTDYRKMLDDDGLDAVCVSTPSFTHARISADAIEAGKPVLCEKPAGGSLKEMDLIAQALDEYGGTFNSVFQWRYGRGVSLFRKLQKRNITGPILWARSDTLWMRKPEYYADSWRGTWEGEKGGALITLAIHAIDTLCSILARPKSVYSNADTLNHDIETDDVSSSVIRLEDGSIANINVTSCSHTDMSSVKIICGNVLAESNEHPYSTSSWPWSFTSSDNNIQEQIDQIVNEADRENEGRLHHSQMRDFIVCLQEGREPPVTITEARRSLELITGIYKSAFTGEPVEFPIHRDDPFYSSMNADSYTEWRR